MVNTKLAMQYEGVNYLLTLCFGSNLTYFNF